MHKKYFFFDIDGTLTDMRSGRIVASAKEALLRLQQQGHFVAIATGRAHYKARIFMDSIPLQHMVCNGGNGIVFQRTVIENHPLPRLQAIALYKEAYAAGYGVLVMCDDSNALYGSDMRFLQQAGERREPTTYQIHETFCIDQIPDIYKLYISIPETEENRLKTLHDLGHLRLEKPYLMIQHDCKNTGIRKMLTYVDGDPKDVVVFGDDTNDLVMFDPTWTSIAMGNACDALKQKANYITDTNIADGIWNACRHFHWI